MNCLKNANSDHKKVHQELERLHHFGPVRSFLPQMLDMPKHRVAQGDENSD
jgi:hypothetical protein